MPGSVVFQVNGVFSMKGLTWKEMARDVLSLSAALRPLTLPPHCPQERKVVHRVCVTGGSPVKLQIGGSQAVHKTKSIY